MSRNGYTCLVHRWVAWLGLLGTVACSTPQRLSGESLHAPFPRRCLGIDTSPQAIEHCAEVNYELRLMVGDGYCGFRAWRAFEALVELGPAVHACLVHQLEHAENPAIADNAAAVLMTTGCEGSILTWCEDHGWQSRCERAQYWHRLSLGIADIYQAGAGTSPAKSEPPWSRARLRVVGPPSSPVVVRVVRSETGDLFYADPSPDGAFAIPFSDRGRYRITVFFDDGSNEDTAPSFDLVIDEHPGDYRSVKRFGRRVIELVVQLGSAAHSRP